MAVARRPACVSEGLETDDLDSGQSSAAGGSGREPVRITPEARRRQWARRTGTGTGEIGREEPDGLRLRVLRTLSPMDVANLAGMIKAPSSGAPRRLEDFHLR